MTEKLTEERLLEVFKSLTVAVRANDLKTPTKDFVVRVFDTFLKDLQIDLGNLRPFESIVHLESNEMTEWQFLILLSRCMTEIFSSHNCPLAITVRDITEPKPKRTKKIMNYLVTFWSYILRANNLFRQVQSDLQPELEKAEDVKQESHNYYRRYQDCAERLSTLDVPKDELLKLVSMKEEICKQSEKDHQVIVDDYQLLKKKESDLVTELGNMDVTIATMKEKLSELDGLILTSPEKIKIDQQKLKDSIKEVDEKILEKEKEKKEKKKNMQSRLSFQDHLQKCIAKLQNLQSEQQAFDEIVQSSYSLHVKSQEEKEKLEKMQSTEQMEKAMTNFYEEKLAKIEGSKKTEIEKMKETLEMLTRQFLEEKQHSDVLAQFIIKKENEINKEINDAKLIVDALKEAEAKTEELKKVFTQKWLEITDAFKRDLKFLNELYHNDIHQ